MSTAAGDGAAATVSRLDPVREARTPPGRHRGRPPYRWLPSSAARALATSTARWPLARTGRALSTSTWPRIGYLALRNGARHLPLAAPDVREPRPRGWCGAGRGDDGHRPFGSEPRPRHLRAADPAARRHRLAEQLANVSTLELRKGEQAPPAVKNILHRILSSVILIASNAPNERLTDERFRRQIGRQASLSYVGDASHTQAIATHPARYRGRVLGCLEHGLDAQASAPRQ